MEDWDAVAEQHGPSVVRIAMRLLGNSEDAEDVAQEVFLQVFELQKRQPITNWTAILARIATRRSIDALRRRRDVRQLDHEPAIEDSSRLEESRFLVARLRDELAHLPSRQAEVFAMRYFEELDNLSIAAALQMTTSAVSTALGKARSTLTEQLNFPRCEDSKR